MTDKTKILAEIERLKMNWRLGMSAEAKYRVEAYTELIDFINSIPEEPVSEDLQEAAWFYADKKACLDKSIFTQKEINEKRSKLEYNWEDIRTAFKAGAQWQFGQLEKNRLKACEMATKEEIEREQDFCDKIIIGEHRQPTFSDAIEYGIKWQREKMLKDAVEREVKVDAGGYPYIDATELYDYDKDEPLAKAGDKVKVIIIKAE